MKLFSRKNNYKKIIDKCVGDLFNSTHHISRPVILSVASDVWRYPPGVADMFGHSIHMGTDSIGSFPGVRTSRRTGESYYIILPIHAPYTYWIGAWMKSFVLLSYREGYLTEA